MFRTLSITLSIISLTFTQRLSAIAKSTLSLCGYFGGKSSISKFLYTIFPSTEKKYKTYIEPFSGSFAVYFKEDMSVYGFEEIVYNDINYYMVNFMSCFQVDNEFDAIYKQYLQKGQPLYFDITKTEEERKAYFKSLFYQWREELEPISKNDVGIYNVELGLKYGFLINHCFNSCNPFTGGFSYKETKSNTTKYHQIGKRINDADFIAKAKAITTFSSLDFETVMDQYDSTSTYCLIDCPYAGFEAYYVSDDEFSFQDHFRLAKTVARSNADIMVTYYDYPGLGLLYPKENNNWYNYQFSTSAGSHNGESSKGNEVIITNY